MLRLTFTRRFRRVVTTALWTLFLIDLALAAAHLAAGLTVPIVLWVMIAVLVCWLALAARAARRPGVAELREAHSQLWQRCRVLRLGKGATYYAADRSQRRVVGVRRGRVGVLPFYGLVVGEIDEDWDYNPDTMRNLHFVIARGYQITPLLADIRHFTDAATIDEDTDTITGMDTPPAQSIWREIAHLAGAPHHLVFTPLEEVLSLAKLLDETQPIHPTH